MFTLHILRIHELISKALSIYKTYTWFMCTLGSFHGYVCGSTTNVLLMNQLILFYISDLYYG